MPRSMRGIAPPVILQSPADMPVEPGDTPLGHDPLRDLLTVLQAAPQVYVAYSGGVDSHVLLHYCAQHPAARGKLTALHVHHGLQPQADAWLEHCAAQAAALGAKFISRRVDARPRGGESPEAAARDARYRAFTDVVQDGEVILAAQHRDDQMETVLLQLFRGAGLAGLAAMPRQARCGAGQLLRPLLDVPKTAILAYAALHRLAWVEDPSNALHDFDRNYLRQALVPLLKRRWPGLDKTVARSARHCADAENFIAVTLAGHFATAYDATDGTLDVAYLSGLERYPQQWLLRQWCKTLTQTVPSEHTLNRVLDEAVAAAPGQCPAIPWQGGMVRRYHGRLYWQASRPVLDRHAVYAWGPDQTSLDLPGNGQLSLSLCEQPGAAPEHWRQGGLSVGYRRGGESLRLPGRAGSHSLKKLYQERGIPPWMRDNIPLLFIDGRLAAVADLWVCDEFYRREGQNCQVHWQRL